MTTGGFGYRLVVQKFNPWDGGCLIPLQWRGPNTEIEQYLRRKTAALQTLILGVPTRKALSAGARGCEVQLKLGRGMTAVKLWVVGSVLALALALGVGSAWTLGSAGEPGGRPQTAARSQPAEDPMVTARWRYAPVPDDDMAAVQQINEQLGRRYRKYRQAWQAYRKQLFHCQGLWPAGCAANRHPGECQDRVMMLCLGPVIPPLDAARHGVHDQAIELEQAAQRLTEATG